MTRSANMSETQAEPPGRFHLWMVVIAAAIIIRIITHSSRWLLHGGTIGALALIRYGRPRQLRTPIVASVFAIVLNALVTARIVLPFHADPYSAVAGVKLQRLELTAELEDWSEGAMCFETYSQAGRAVMADGRRLGAPFLPLPIDWTDIDDSFLSEQMCPS